MGLGSSKITYKTTGENITKKFNPNTLSDLKDGKEIINSSGKKYIITKNTTTKNATKNATKSNNNSENYTEIFEQNESLNNKNGKALYKQAVILYNFNLLFTNNPKLEELFNKINVNMDEYKIPKKIKKLSKRNTNGKYSGKLEKMYVILLVLYTSKDAIDKIEDPEQKKAVKEFFGLLNDEYRQFDNIFKSYFNLSIKQQEELKAYIIKYKKEKEVSSNGKTSPSEAFLKNPDVSDEEKKNALEMIKILLETQTISGMKIPLSGARKFIKNKLYLFVLDSNVNNLFNSFYGIGVGKNNALNLGKNLRGFENYYGLIRNKTTVGYEKKCIINLLLTYNFEELKSKIESNNLTTKNEKLITILLSMMYEFNKIIPDKVEKNNKPNNNKKAQPK